MRFANGPKIRVSIEEQSVATYCRNFQQWPAFGGRSSGGTLLVKCFREENIASPGPTLHLSCSFINRNFFLRDIRHRSTTHISQRSSVGSWR